MDRKEGAKSWIKKKEEKNNKTRVNLKRSDLVGILIFCERVRDYDAITMTMFRIRLQKYAYAL